jgi:hypothetical protein
MHVVIFCGLAPAPAWHFSPSVHSLSPPSPLWAAELILRHRTVSGGRCAVPVTFRRV